MRKSSFLVLPFLCILLCLFFLNVCMPVFLYAQPVISSYSPLRNTTATALNSDIVLTWSEAMNTATLTSGNVRVYGSQTGLYTTSATFTPSGGNMILTVDPTLNFKPGELISISVTNAQNASNTPMTRATVWGFTSGVTGGGGGLAEAWTQGSGATDTYIVEIGDLDGDGDLDVFEGNDGNNKVWLNDGNGNFTNTWTQGSGATTTLKVVLGDVDGDGDLDVFEGNNGDNNKVWSNDGSGNFTNTWTQGSSATSTYSVALGDLDGDGDLDVYEGNYLGNNKVWSNDGSGNFSNTWTSSIMTDTRDVVLGDLDGDGDLDAFEGGLAEQNRVWLNDGNGNFTNTWTESGGDNTQGIALGDMDGDGDIDMVEGIGGNNKVWKNDGSGNFTNTWTQSGGGTNTQRIVLGDMDGDGDLDVFEGSKNINNKVWSNDGSGNLTITWGQSSGITATQSIAVGDLDGDGDLDVFEGNSNQNNKVWLSVPSPAIESFVPTTNALAVVNSSAVNITFSTSMNVSTLTSANIRIMGSQTGTYSTSAVVYNSTSNTVSLQPSTTFKPGELLTVSVTTGVQSADGVGITQTTLWSFVAEVQGGGGAFGTGWTQSSGAANTQSIAMGDVDGDGDLDVFEGNYGANNKVWQNDGNGNFTNTWTQSGGATQTISIALGDVDGDGDLDVFEGNDAENNKVWQNDGSGNFSNTWTQSSGATETRSIVFGDLDGDGDVDAFEGNDGENNKVWSNDGSGSFTNTWTQSSGATSTRSIALGDVDGDGDLDVFEGNNTQNNKVWSNDGSGSFTNTWTQSSGATNTYSIVLGDLDGDGDVDAFEGNYFTGNNKVWRNDGSGNFTNTWTQSSGATSTRSIALGDLDGDGDLDVFEGNLSANNKVWQNDGNGNFTNTWTQSSGTTTTQGVALGDVDGDGDLDAFEGQSNINNTVWLNVILPVVESFAPSTNALAVVNSSAVNITFSTSMNVSTLTSANIRIVGSQTGTYSTSAVAYNSTSNTVSLQPSSVFKPGELLTVSVTTGVQSADGVGITQTTLWSFVTAVQGGNGAFGTGWTQSSSSTNTFTIALGDLDGDGDVDVFEGNRNLDNKVWLNDGSGNFSNTWTQSSGATNTFAIVLGDVDGDGDLDVFEGNLSQDNKVWLNDGSGNFSNTWTQSSGATPTYSIALGDLDGDGDLDMFEGNFGDNDKVWSNDGSGNFTNTWTQASGSSDTHNVVLGDFDGDGDLDVFEGNQSEFNKVWTNDGSGSFTNTWTESITASATYSIAVGDVDGDGDVDVFEGNQVANNKVWSNDGSGSFTNTWTQSSGATNTFGIVLGDLDGDGDLDAFEGNLNQNNKVWSNDGSGNFTNTWTQRSGATPTYSIALGDLDGDGDLDVFEGNYSSQGNTVWLNVVPPAVASFAPSTNALAVANNSAVHITFSTSMNVSTLTSANIRITGSQTGTYSTSAVAYNSTNNTVSLQPSSVFKPGELLTVSVTTGVQSADDVGITQTTLWSFVTAVQGGNGAFGTGWTQSSGATNTYSIALGDVDGDGDVDVFEGNQGGNNKVWLNDGSGNFTNTWIQSSGATITLSIAMGDVDGDGDVDVFEGNYNSNNKVWLNDGSGNFTNTWTQSSGATHTQSVAMGDLDGDGDLDVFEGNYLGESSKVWQNDGSGSFTNTWTQSGGTTGTRSIALGDMDGDGDLDVFEGNELQANKVWSNDGDGNFTDTWTQSSGATDTWGIAVGDVDGDGDLDVFEGNQGGNNKVWKNDGSGSFTNTWTQSSGATYTVGIAMGDMDGDGDLDVLEGNYGESNKVWSNDGSGNFTNTWTQSNGATSTYSIALGDMDGDGDVDMFEGNDGENNKAWLNVVPPAVASVAPSTNALAVANNSAVHITFSTSMNVSTLTSANIRIIGSQTGMYSTSAVVYNSTSNTVSLQPSSAFKPGELITVGVTTGVQSSAGATVTRATVWSFAVAAVGGTGLFIEQWQQGASTATNTFSVALGDLDNDGDVDVFEANNGAVNKVWLNDGGGNFTNSWSTTTASATQSAVLGDVDGDGDLDVFEGNNAQANMVWLNDGSGNFVLGWTQSSSTTNTNSVVFGDVDGDGDLDIFEGNNGDNNKVWSNDGSGVFTNTWEQSSGASATQSVILSDVDNDGDVDVFEGNLNSNNKVWLNDGSGSFTNIWIQSSGTSATQSVSFGDLDGDGDADVFEGNNGSLNKVWLNDGSGNFVEGWTQSSSATLTRSVVLADIDGDGDLDVFEGNDGEPNTVWLNDGNGVLNLWWTESGVGSSTGGVSAADMDSDGDIDVFEGNSFGEENKVWLNGRLRVVVESQSTSATTSGGDVSLTLQLQTEGGTPFTVVQGSKLVTITADSPLLQFATSVTQATVVAGQQSTTLTVSLYNTTLSPITTSLTIQLVENQSIGTVATLTIGANIAPEVGTNATAIEILEDGVTRLTVSVWDVETTTSSLVVSATSGNVLLLPNTAVVQVGTTGATTAFDISPATNGTGVVEVYVSASDGLSSVTTSFTVTVNPVNDAPSFATGANVTVLEDSGAYSGAFATSVDDGDGETTQSLSFVVSNDNTSLFTVQPSISSTTGNLSFTVASNANGLAVVTVYVQDDGGTSNGGVNTSATQTFVVRVTPVNDAPSFATGANVTVLDEDGGQSFAGYLTGISSGPADELGQSVEFLVSNDNNTLFTVQPSVSTTGTLVFTPAQWAEGVATVNVYAQDDGGTANGGVDTSTAQSFTITVGLSPATHLRMVGVTVPAQSGETVQVAVASYTALGTQRATTANTTVGLVWDATYLPVLSGSTQALLGIGSSEATISVSMFSSSTATITMPATVEAVGNVLGSTMTSFTVQHAVPSVPTATTNNQQASLQWVAPVAQGVTGYAVYRGTVSGSLSEIGTSATTSYVDNTAVNGTTYYYAVKSAAGILRSGLSGEASTVVPLLTVVMPNGGEEWRIGTEHTVSWQTVGTVASVSVEYSTDNGDSWLPIVLATSNTGSAVWHIETATTSTTALVRVHDVTRLNVRDQSNVAFSIIEPIAAVTSLSASALHEAIQLSWSASTTAGVTGYRLYHGMTSGTLSSLATFGTTATTYTHSGLDDGLSHYYALGTLIDSDESALSGEVSAVPNTFRLLYPNGGETLQAGTQQNLQWQYSGDISSMRIEYSTDSGLSWTAIAQIVTLAGNKPLTTFYQEWIVENTPTTTALVRVVSVTPSGIADASDAVFTIQAIAPPTNLVATAGSTTISLSWTASTAASISGYRLLRGTTTTSMSEIASIGAATTSYTDVSANACTQYYYAVQTRVGSFASANSNIASARIALPENITVVSPNGGESWQVGVTRSITWTSTACTVPSSVTLEYSTNNGGSWSTIATVSNTGSYSWLVPNAPSAQALVRVSGNALTDQGDAVFTIAPIPAPSALVATAGDGSVGLSWTSSSAEGLSGYGVWRGTTSGSLSLLATVGAATTSYTDNSVTNCTLYVYGVTAMVNAWHSASSNEVLAVPQIPPALVLTSPNGGEGWQVGVTRSITWTSTGCSVPSMVTLEYSANNGGSWSTIATVANTGSYAWIVPNAVSAQALVRVDDGTLQDQSDAVFTIPAIPVPTGLAATAGDGTVELNWTASGAESLSGYGVWRGTTSGSLSLLTTVGAATTSYTDNSVTNCTLYVYAVTSEVGAFRSALSTEVEAVPVLPASIMVLTPNGGEQWRMYLPHEITWTSTGCSVPATVSIELSLNNGGSWTSVTTATANTGSYTWTPVGLTPSVQALIRVSGGALSDVSNAVFELQPRPYPSAVASPVATSASYCLGSGIPSMGTSLSLSDDYFSATSLVVSVASSNPALLPTSGIVQTSVTGATTTFSFAPVANTAGVATVTFTVRNAIESTVTTTVSVSVVVHALPSAVITGSTSACAGSAGHMYSVPTEAGGTYTWTVVGGSVTSGAGTREITVEWENSGIGNVGVVVTTADDGCWASDLLAVNIHANPVPSIAVGGATTFCSGGAVVLTAEQAGMSYVWSNGATTQSISVTESGIYSVMLTSQYGCSMQSTAVTITVLPGIAVSVSADTTVCAGSSVELQSNVSSAVGGLSFVWSPSTGLSNTSTPHPIASPSATTVYTLTVHDANGCSSTASVTITVTPAPVTTISSNATICIGNSTQLEATGGTSYSWTPSTGLSNAAIANPVATPSATTTYTVMINTGGCPVQRSVTVTVVAPPAADAGSNVDICNGTSTQLLATGGTSYSWTPSMGLSNANIANPVATPSATTTYTVTVSNAGGCSSTASVTVTVNPLMLSATVLLEGAYSGGSMPANLQAQGLLPTNQPYNVSPFNYAGTEVLGVTSGTAIVDWVLVDLRSGTGAGSLVERRAALLRSDGAIVGSDGGALVYTGISANSYYVVVWHRNHLAVMSARPANVVSNCSLVYNFSSSPVAAYSQFGTAQRQVGGGSYGMAAGDVASDGIVDAVDRVAVRNASGALGYEQADASLDGVVDAVDRVFVRNNAFWVTQVP